MPDQDLMRRIMLGDREALETLIVRHQACIFGYLRARLMQPSDAEDLTQEVFLRFYLARARFDSSQLVRPWLLGIARNLLRERVRKARRQREIAWTELCLELEDIWQPAESLYEDFQHYLPGCLSALGESARAAIDLYYTDNYSLAKIAERLKRSEGAVKLLVFRARQALKRCIDKQFLAKKTAAAHKKP